MKPETRIVGGTKARPGDWPWQAMLRSPHGWSFCGGTLLAPVGPYCLSLFMEKETPGSSGSVCCNWIRPCESTNALTKTSVFVLTKLQKLCVYS